MESINEKIKRIRIEIGINQADVARSAGIKQSSYASIEKGDTKSISIDVGKGIAKALRISFNELFDIQVPNNSFEIEELQSKILDLEREIKSRDRIIADYSNMFDNYRDQIEFIKKFYSEAGMIVQFIESLIDKLEGAPAEMKEEMKALLHAHLNNTKSPE